MALFGSSIKKKDLAEFFQKMSMLLDTGYDACSAAKLLGHKSENKKRGDHSADGIRKVAVLLLPNLTEGFSLHEAMAAHPKYFGEYVNQVEVGEAAGKTAEVLQRICDQIKNANKIMSKLKSALTYPVVTLLFTFAAAYYLFTAVIPDMLNMLSDVGVSELPAATKIVMAVGDWVKSNGLQLGSIFLIALIVFIVYSKTVGKMAVSKLTTRLPLIGKIVQNNSMTLFFSNWQQMILAGAEMSVALKSAAEAVPNLYIRKEMMGAYFDYKENGIAVYETLGPIDVVRDLETKTIQVAIEGSKLGRTLGILAEDRAFEADKSISTMTAAINPIMMLIVGLIVGVLVMSVYGPIMSVSSAL